jgi:hypothetical protein
VKLTGVGRIDYCAKMGLADEIAKPAFKRARGHGRTPMQLLYDIMVGARRRESIAADVERWLEYAKAMRGCKQLTWSRGLRERYQLGDEQTELDLSRDLAADLPGNTVWTFETDDWDDLLAGRVGLRLRALRAAEELPPIEARDAICRLVDRARGHEVPF